MQKSKINSFQLEKAQAEGKLTPEMMANLGEQASKVEEEVGRFVK